MPPNIRPGPGGPPGQAPGPPPPQQFMPQMRNSTRVVDVTPRQPLNENDCKKKLTTYDAYTLRKQAPRDPKKEKPSWAKSEVTKELLDPSEVSKQVKKLNEGRRTVSEKKNELQPFQQKQISTLLDELNAGERDPYFNWSLTQLDSKIKSLKTGKRETLTITCYVKRAPHDDVNPVGIFQALERRKQERMAEMTRPPPPAQQPPPQGGGNGSPGPGIVKLGGNGAKMGGGRSPSRLPGPKKRSNRKYHGHGDDLSSRSSAFDSDTESSSSYSSDNTTLSSRSDGRHRRHSDHVHNRNRSRSKPREHRRPPPLYLDDRFRSPDLGLRDSFGSPTYVPEVPQAVRPAPPPFDAVAAAYQAGKIDADAERLGLDRLPRIRPAAAERAIVSYGRPEPRYHTEPRFVEPRYAAEPRYTHEPRYAPDHRFIDDIEELRIRDELRRHEVEDYIDRRASEPRVDYIPHRGHSPRIYTHHNPFSPIRRYAPSFDSFSSGR